MEPFVGQIIPVGFNFAPPGWFLCQGQLVPIANFPVLVQLLGTTYGGDGQTTFGIPNLQGRVPLHDGQGTGLSNYIIGEVTGTESVTLLSSQNGQHSHPFMTSTQTSNGTTPDTTTALGVATTGNNNNIFVYGAAGGTTTTLAPTSIGQAGGSIPHENRQPFGALNFIIAWAGIFPSRN